MKIFIDQDLGIADATVGLLETEYELVETFEEAALILSFKHPAIVEDYEATDDQTVVWVAPIASLPLSTVIKSAAKTVDIVVAPSLFALNVLKASDVPNIYSDVIPFSYNQDLYTPIGEEERNTLRDEYDLIGKTVIGYSGPHDAHVNLMPLLFAFKELAIENAVLMLHTQVDAPHADFNLLELVENLELGDEVLIIDGPASADVYQMMDLLVQPTSAEMVGFQNMRALACGVPCITTKYGGQIDLYDKQSTFIPVVDYEVMSDTTHWAIVDKFGIATAISEALASKHVSDVSKYTHDKVQPSWLKLIEGL